VHHFGDHGAAKEEAKINELYKSLTGRKHLWLAEHKQYGATEGGRKY